MSKKIIGLGFSGFFVGVVIGYAISLIQSAIVGNGNFYPVAPDFMTACGTELNATVIQFFLTGILGVFISISSTLFDTNKLNLLMQTVLHFFIITTATSLVAFICKWIPYSVIGVIIWFAIFFIIYAIIWIAYMVIAKKHIAQINERLKSQKQKSLS